ncbi:hypothetical protein DFJ58DRAFT_763586 [Suillus subalutaceus]|uniref:uncharacterized protein n=1 Tax=Suillus subalutaceus TaxID=48586 RepID=UPI001B860595|nr:uncharacterized protein DFJ58DRAFT_763586 [Suillus subalutaceus]KAG1871373.1 hypothetical protein DFJ58DRAFT_763586 [Suillus subalutaceus]
MPDVSINLTPIRYPIPNECQAQNYKRAKKSLSGANATRRPPIHPVPRQLPAGFFDDVQGRDPSSITRHLHPDTSLHRRRRTFALSWGPRPRAFLARLPRLFRRSQTNVDEPIKSQRRPVPSTSSRRSPPVVEVPALDDKKALYTARRPERASDKAKRIKNPKWWARIVLFLCCASPSTGDNH